MSNVFYGTTPHDQLQHKVCEQCWGPNGNLIDLPSDFLFPDHANFGDFTLLFCRGQLRIVHWNASTQLLFYPSNLLFCHAFVAVAVVVCFLKVPILMLGLKKEQIDRWSRHSSVVLVSPHYLYYHPTPLNKKRSLFLLDSSPRSNFFLFVTIQDFHSRWLRRSNQKILEARCWGIRPTIRTTKGIGSKGKDAFGSEPHGGVDGKQVQPHKVYAKFFAPAWNLKENGSLGESPAGVNSLFWLFAIDISRFLQSFVDW